MADEIEQDPQLAPKDFTPSPGSPLESDKTARNMVGFLMSLDPEMTEEQALQDPQHQQSNLMMSGPSMMNPHALQDMLKNKLTAAASKFLQNNGVPGSIADAVVGDWRESQDFSNSSVASPSSFVAPKLKMDFHLDDKQADRMHDFIKTPESKGHDLNDIANVFRHGDPKHMNNASEISKMVGNFREVLDGVMKDGHGMDKAKTAAMFAVCPEGMAAKALLGKASKEMGAGDIVSAMGKSSEFKPAEIAQKVMAKFDGSNNDALNQHSGNQNSSLPAAFSTKPPTKLVPPGEKKQ